MKKLPKPQTVRFQVSMRGHRYANLAEARKDFLRWLDDEQPESEIQVHIWSNEKERVLTEIGNDPRGEVLKQVLRRALQSGKLQIRETRQSGE